MYLGNNLGITIPRGQWRKTGPSILRLHRPIKKIPKSIREHKEAVVVRGRIVTEKPKVVPTPVKKTFKPEVKTTWRRPVSMRGGRLAQWEAAIPAAAGVAAKIFGGKKEEKKAASIARRQGDAMKAASVIQPLTNLINQSIWDNIQNSFLTAAQTGQSFGIAASAIAQGGYEFASKARDLINSTSPSAVIRKSGGYPSWTDLQTKLTSIVSGMRPSPPTAPRPTFFQPTTLPLRPAPRPGQPAYYPGQPTFQQPYLPTPRPAPAPQIITIPAPAQVIGPAPAKAGIDPTWLIMGGLGLAAVMMMNR